MPRTILSYASSDEADQLAATGFLSSDPFAWVECDDRKIIVVGGFERDRALRESRCDEVITENELGVLDLARGGLAGAALELAVCAELVRRLEIREATVPWWMPAGLVDGLRAQGLAIEVADDLFGARRRRKDERDVANVALARDATEQAFALIRKRLASADVAADGTLTLDGAALTSERLHADVRVLWAGLGCEGETPIIAGGAHAADPHDVGSGPLRAGETIICDLFPRHTRSRMHADMTRTFVVGDVSDEIADWHATCHDALRQSFAMVRPGVLGKDVNQAMVDLFRERGYGSTLHPEVESEASCPHGLGHGVGLHVHEEPALGVSGHAPLAVGDLVTLEPGLYRPGVGGVRLEDMALVTEDGCRNLCSFPLGLAVR